MNETECENLIKSVKWTDPTNLISLAILEFINISVISGNLLVIAAVFCSNKLRSVTNFFIVNLAVADLLVGLAVLPFSATWEVFKVWIFGDVWCRIWLAVDVWMCTASILNLCAISLDRYVAVTRPVTYPSIMSKKRAKSLIAGIWVLSFVICFPPLVGWKDQKHLAQPLTYTEGNQTLFFATTNVTRATTSAIEVTINETFSTIWPNQAVAKLFRRNKRNHHYNRFAMVTLKVKSSPVKRLGIQTNDYNIHDLKINNDAVFPIQNANDDYNDYTNDNNNHNNVISTPLTLHYEPTMSTSSSASRSASKSASRSAFVSTSLPLSTSSNTKKSFSDETVFERILIKNKPNNFNSDITNINKNNLDDRTAINCPWKCELTNDRGYVLYSALGSFYIPMFVMLFFYWRIYRAAIRTTKAINQGFKTTKGLQHFGAHFDEQRLTLRIHRGRSSSKAFDSIHCNGSTQSTCTTLDTPSPERLSKLAGLRRSQYYGHDKIKISVSYPSNDNLAEMTCEKVTNQQQMERQQQQQQLHCKLSNCSSNMLFAVQYNLPGARDAHVKSQIYRHNLDVNEEQQCVQHRRTLSTTSRANNTKKMGKRNIKAQVKKFRMETKAAKTLAIIVGLFILCWLPFFTIYIIRPFCNNCIDPILFSVLFWLGYCNSAVNPMIYALFSKDFRFAFQRIICQCFCFEHHDKKILKKHVRRDSDMSTVRIRVRTPSLTTSAAAHSFCDESEYQQPTEISECDRVKR